MAPCYNRLVRSLRIHGIRHSRFRILGPPVERDPKLSERREVPPVDEAISDKIMNGALCAVIAGDAQMLSRLIKRRADVNYRVSGLSDLGFYDSQTLLMVAAKSHQSAEVLSTLLELRADVNARDRSGLNSAFYARSAQQVKAGMFQYLVFAVWRRFSSL